MDFRQKLEGWEFGGDRMSLAVRLAKGRRVLHVGCVDEGMASRETLHHKLDKVCKVLIGVDTAPRGIEFAGSFPKREFFDLDFQIHRWRFDIPAALDLVVCTEVLEHLDAVGPFLRNLRSVGARAYLFTVPNAFSEQHAEYIGGTAGCPTAECAELVHPDHRCWFSPYTLENCLKHAGYTPIERWMVGRERPASLFRAEGVAILCE